MGFEERKQQEDEYIQYWIDKHPDWKQNPTGPLPDLTKPDGTYQDIKFINFKRNDNTYDLCAQKKGIKGSEIDNWKENGILEDCEYKFIAWDKKIYIVNCKLYLNSVFKKFDEREPSYRYSGTAFYLCRINDFKWKKLENEIYKNNEYEVKQAVEERIVCLTEFM